MLKKNMMNFCIFFQIFVVCFCYFVPVFLIESHFVLSLFYIHLGVSINNVCFHFVRFFLLFCQLAILKTKLPICVRGSYEITLEHWCVINFWLRECDHAEPRINVLIYFAKQIIVMGAHNDDDFF